MNSKFLGSLLVIGIAIMAAGAGTIAYFHDTETSKGNTFTAGELDLHIDWTEYYNGELIEERALGDLDGEPIFMLEDIKPGDNGEATISIHVANNPALLWITLENIVDNENGMNEPEMEVDDDNTGDLSEHMMFTIWIDDGNNILDPGETIICEDTLADVGTIGPAYIENCCVYYLGVHWWVPWDTGNVIQSDSLSADISFYAEQARHNPAMEDAYFPPCPSDNMPVECPDCPYGDNYLESDNISVLSMETSGFPSISAFVRVNTSAGIAGDLVDDFELCEQGKQPLDLNVSFTSGTSADIVFVFDDTGSMYEEIDGMKTAISSFVDKIDNAGIDARYALISFKDTVTLRQDFTDNEEVIQSAIGTLSASGGGDYREDDFDAIAAATRDKAPDVGGSLSAYRAAAQRVIIDITDAPAQVSNSISSYTMGDIENMLEGYTYIAISPELSATYADGDKKVLASNIGATWFELPTTSSSEFVDTLVDEVGGLLTTTYTLTYTTCYPAEDGTLRNILIVVDDPDEGMLYKTASYTAPAP